LTLIYKKKGILAEIRKVTSHVFDYSYGQKNVFRLVIEIKSIKSNLKIRN